MERNGGGDGPGQWRSSECWNDGRSRPRRHGGNGVTIGLENGIGRPVQRQWEAVRNGCASGKMVESRNSGKVGEEQAPNSGDGSVIGNNTYPSNKYTKRLTG